MKEWCLSQGSARTERIDKNGKHPYVYDGALNKDYEMELVLGLPASGKSTMVTDPDSEEMGAFIIDCDMIKEQLPEYQESHGAAADAVHFEGYGLMLEALKEFLKGGSMEGTNVILPIVSSDLDDLMETFIEPFESAGYHVKAKFCAARPNEAAARVVMRELGGGQLINSNVAFGFGNAPEEVYKELSVMLNSFGEPYGTDVEAEDLAA
jgi:predicted ABC-type ATPase